MAQSNLMTVMLVAGARPNFMKISAIIDAIKTYNQSHSHPIAFQLVHTGQHYDQQMSQAFFHDLGMPKPHVDLGVGSGTHAQQTAEIMKRIEPVLMETRPDVLLVVGDVNSTVGCALVAAKISYPGAGGPKGRLRPLIVHVEAGLRSFDREMPEEINRVLTDSLSDLLFTTEQGAMKQLQAEGIDKSKVFFVGNTMVDTLLKHRGKALQSEILWKLGLGRAQQTAGSQKTLGTIKPVKQTVDPYGVLTLHRPSNVDQPKTLKPILDAVQVIGNTFPIVFPVHPRTRIRLGDFGFQRYFANSLGEGQVMVKGPGLYGIDPLSYLDFLCLTSHAKLVLTDSGGIQEETTILGVPCVTIRENTERPITVTQGTNVLAGVSTQSIVACAKRQLTQKRKKVKPKYWDGKAGARIVKVLSERACGT